MRTYLLEFCQSSQAAGGSFLLQKFPNPESIGQFLTSPMSPIGTPFILLNDRINYSISEQEYDNLEQFLETSNLNPIRQTIASIPLFFAHKLLSNAAASLVSYLVDGDECYFKSFTPIKKFASRVEPALHYFVYTTTLSLINHISSAIILNYPESSFYLGLYGYEVIQNEALLLLFCHGTIVALCALSKFLFHEQASKAMKNLNNLPQLDGRVRNRRKTAATKLVSKSTQELKRDATAYLAFSKIELAFTHFKRGELLRRCENYTQYWDLNIIRLFLMNTVGFYFLYENLQSQLTTFDSGIMINCERSNDNYNIFLSSVFTTSNSINIGHFICFGMASTLYCLMGVLADIVTSAFYKKTDNSIDVQSYISSYTFKGILKSIIQYVQDSEVKRPSNETSVRESYPLSDEQSSLVIPENSEKIKRRKTQKGKEKESSSDEDTPHSASSSSIQTQISTGVKLKISHLDYREFFHIENLSIGNMMAFGIVLNKDNNIATAYVNALKDCTAKTVLRINEDGFSSKLYRTKKSDDRLLGYSGSTAIQQLEKYAFDSSDVVISIKALEDFARSYGKSNIEIHTFNDVYTHKK